MNNEYLLMLDMEISDLKKLSKDQVVREHLEKIEKLNENQIFINWITKEKNEIAKNLLEQNVDISIIMSATGLAKEEIEKLQK